MKAHSSQYNSTAVSVNKFAKGALQQAGFQVGDYAVQVANGTSAMQAFGQQGSQFFGIFGPLGAVLGAGIAIVSAIAVAFEKSGKTAKSFADQIKDTTQSIDLYNSASKKALQSSDDLAEKYGEAADQARALFKAQEGLRKLEAVDDLKKSVIALRDEFGDFGGVSQESIQAASDAFAQYGDKIFSLTNVSDKEFLRANKAIEVYRSSVKDLEVALGATTPEAFELASELASLSQAEGPKEISAALESVRQRFTEIVGGIDNATDSQRNLLKQLLESAVASLNLNANIDQTKDETEEAKQSASGLADELERAALAVQNINVSAFDKLAALQSELRARTRGLTDEQVRIQQAARRAEIAARKEGATGAELAGIAAEAAAAEREIIKAEQALLKFTETGSSVTKVKNKTQELVDSLSPFQEKMQEVGKTIESSMEGAFMSVVDGTNSAKDAFRNMASAIIKELYRVFVVKKITGFITSAITSSFGPGMTTGTPLAVPSGDGSSLLPPSFAGGGYTGSRARVGGLDGKGGFMAMLHPRETVVDHTKGQGGGVVVNQTINVSTGVQQTVRTEIKSLMPQIAESAKSAVVDAKRRGGSYGRAFA